LNASILSNTYMGVSSVKEFVSNDENSRLQ
jgi:hypothetical protein